MLLLATEHAASIPPAMSGAMEALRLDLLFKLALAVLLGGLIGLEREISGKPAGLRTNILICVGATLLTDISIAIGVQPDGSRIGDPARLAAQIVSGIGFIGAGTILQAREGTITGLTTAATIWVVAALGIAIGAGFYVEAAGTGLLVACVLAGLGNVEYRLRRARRIVNCTVRAKPGTPYDALAQRLADAGIRVLSYEIYDHPNDRTFEMRLVGPARQFEIAQDALRSLETCMDVHLGR